MRGGKPGWDKRGRVQISDCRLFVREERGTGRREESVSVLKSGDGSRLILWKCCWLGRFFGNLCVVWDREGALVYVLSLHWRAVIVADAAGNAWEAL